MKKKIVSMILLGMYFFGEFGVVFGLGDPITNTINDTQINLGNSAPPPTTNNPYTDPQNNINKVINDTTVNLSNSSPLTSGTDGSNITPPTGSSNDMTSTRFTLNPNDLSPSEKKYTGATRTNFKTILANIGKYLLIATTTIAVLSIVVGGLMISTTGPTDRAAKGKTIIILNITAIIIALFSYSIIRLVSWIIA